MPHTYRKLEKSIRMITSSYGYGDRFTAQDVAGLLNITPRHARHLLSKIDEYIMDGRTYNLWYEIDEQSPYTQKQYLYFIEYFEIGD